LPIALPAFEEEIFTNHQGRGPGADAGIGVRALAAFKDIQREAAPAYIDSPVSST